MSTICCLTGPSNPSFISPPVLSNIPNHQQIQDKENYNVMLNRHLPSPSLQSMTTYSHHLSIPTRLSQTSTHPLVFVSEENEISDFDNPNDNDKLLLPRSTRAVKRRPSLFEKSRDWARRLITLHRTRRNTISNDKFRSSCYDFHRHASMQKNAYVPSYHQTQKSFDEDGYLSPMEIKAKLDNISREKINYHQSLSKLSSQSQQQLLVYSHSSSDISQPIYRCQGPIPSKCTCPVNDPSTAPSRNSFISDFHRSLSAVDYIDDDDIVSDEISARSNRDQTDSDDPLTCLKYLFNESDQQERNKIVHGNLSRRAPRRSTNTSSISTDSGYCDIPMTSSKLIPVHLISCTLIPVNVTTRTTTTDPIDVHCLACTCSPPTSAMYSSAQNDYERRRLRRRRKSSSNLNRIVSPQQMELITRHPHPPCSCNRKYYSTLTICPTLSSPSLVANKIDADAKDHQRYAKQAEKKRHLRKKSLPIVSDDLIAIARWYKPHLDRDIVCQALQQADYGAFILRDSITHKDCYALSVKVPKFTHDSNIAHYLIERIRRHHASLYRIKGTTKEFPTLLSLVTHHSVMPEILPITLDLHQTLAL